MSDASMARLEIDEALVEPAVDVSVAPATSPPRERFAWASALAVLAVTAVAAVVWALRPELPPGEVRLEIITPSTTDPVSLAISPDGQKVVFVATFEGRSRLWLRSMDSVSARPLAETEDAYFPFWSPDSRSIGFFADGKLKRIDIGGGSPQELANVALGFGGTWNRDGVIVFAPSPASPLFRTSATGGEPVAVTRLETPQQQHHNFPAFLPDGRQFLYYVIGPEARGVYVAQLDGSPPRRLLDAESPAAYAPSGYLLFIRQGTLFAQRFDPRRLELSGDPLPVAEQITVSYGLASPAFSTSAAGPLVYRTGAAVQAQFVWFDRAGRSLEGWAAPSMPSARRCHTTIVAWRCFEPLMEMLTSG
jgi:hypothetical protein